MPGGYSYVGNLRINEATGEISSASVGSASLLDAVADASTIEVDSTTGKLQIKGQGSSLTGGVQRDRMSKYAGIWIRGGLAAASGNGGVFNARNTYGSDLLITRVLVHITTAAEATIDIGTDDDGATSVSNLIDGATLTATGVIDNITDDGSNGKSRQIWENNEYVTATASTTPTGLVGFYAIHAIDLSA